MKVCVVGAGPSGLTTIKQLLDEGHEVVCFDKGRSIGGIWHRHPDDDGEMKAYDNLILSISLKLMSFSDFMVEDRRFVGRKGYLEYLHRYAAEFDLERHVRLNSEVAYIRPAGSEWLVAVRSEGATTEHLFDAVAICSGPFREPNMDVEQLANFQGDVVHSSRYRNNEQYRGKKVLVVGLTESGADIVREISDVSHECTLSIRSRSYLVPRLFAGKYSTDMLTFRASHYEFFVRAADVPFAMPSFFEDEHASRSEFLEAARLSGLVLLGLGSLGGNTQPSTNGAAEEAPDAINNLGEPMWPLKLDLGTDLSKEHISLIDEWNRKCNNGTGSYIPKVIYCKNVSFLPNIANGKIRVDDSGIERIEGRMVHFRSGRVEEFDSIVLCTGFKANFSVLRDVEIPGNNVRNLYKHAFHPACHGRLALIGFTRPFTGGIPICAEMQARYFALLCSRKLDLPDDVRERIKREKEWEEWFTEYSPRHVESIPSQVLYLDSIAKEIGCLPDTRELLADPLLLAKLWCCSFNQASYRLTGPHNMRDAARAAVMGEEFPARSATFVSLFLAMSSLSSSAHPKYADFTEFPFVLEPELEKLVRSSLETTASRAARLFESDRRVNRPVNTGAVLETESYFTPASDDQDRRAPT
ncbi:MAG TPA: NAD(P)-binding domain-containing protein [Gammaproteobacteria bacterium]|nr:NAD(P)-binding domain-containing protein [Gammaproteobacteria bacterium]